MSNPRSSSIRHRRLGALAVVIATCSFILAGARAQETPGKSGKAAKAGSAETKIDKGGARFDTRLVLHVIELKHLKTSGIIKNLTQLVNNLNGGAIEFLSIQEDARTNRLLVVAREEDFLLVKQAVETLDVVGPPRMEGQKGARGQDVQIFNLRPRNIVADKSLEASLKLLIPDAEDGRYVIDTKTNAVVVCGPPETIEKVNDFLAQFQKLSAPPRPAPVLNESLRARVIWLASGDFDGREEKAKAKVPPGMEGVVKELANLGIGNVYQVAQLAVDFSPDTKFGCSGQTRLFQAPCTFLLTGEVDSSVSTKERKHLQLQVSLRPNDAEEDDPSPCQVGTTIEAPIGQYVVLGVTPVGRATSVFVLQLQSPHESK